DMTGIAGYPSDEEGWGLIRLDDVLVFPDSDHILAVWDVRNSGGLSTGDRRVHGIDVVTGSEPLKVTLAWTDPPGEPGAADVSVNDLDLRVTSPDGDTYLGNHFERGRSAVGGPRDDVNNVEVVMLPAPAPGPWIITVAAARVAQGDPGQGYALTVTTASLRRRDWLAPVLHAVMR
ncbi:MAG: hypothetical protein LC749_17135, partial [Actinobacteria bacterium]|nr:hypothetical protein [Actinomycetota bacterium]